MIAKKRCLSLFTEDPHRVDNVFGNSSIVLEWTFFF